MKERLYIWECKKVWNNRSFFRLWLFFLFLAGFFCVWLRQPSNEGQYSPSDYTNLYEVLGSMNTQEAYDTVSSAHSYLSEKRQRSMWSDLNASLSATGQPSAYIPAPIASQDLAGEEAYLALQSILPANEWASERLLSKVKNDIHTVLNRNTYLQETIQSANRILGSSVFLDQISDSTRANMEKTRHDFQKAKSVSISRLYPEEGIHMILDQPIPDVLILLLLFLALHFMAGEGYQNGAENVILACKNGRARSAVSRSVAIGILAGVLWGSFFIVTCICSLSLYSWSDWTRPVQTLSFFAKCLHPMSIGTMIVLFFFWKWCWFFLAGLFLHFLLKVCERERIGIILLLALWAIGYYFWHNIPDNSVFRLFRYGNLYTMLRLDLVWGTYTNLQIGPLWVSSLSFSVWVCVLTASLLALGLYLSRERLLTKHSSLFSLFQLHGRRRHLDRKPSFRGLVSGELFKGYVVLPVGLLLLLLFGLQVYQNRDATIRLGQDAMAYRYYVDPLSREITGKDPDLEATLQQEEQELILALSGNSERYSPEISQILLPGLSRAKDRYQAALEKTKESGKPVLYFFEDVYSLLLMNRDREILHGAQSLLLVLLFMGFFAGWEHLSGMRKMIRSTGFGESRYYLNKLLWLASLSFWVLLLVYGPDLWLTWKTYPMDSVFAYVGSIPLLADFPLPISIGFYLILLYGKRFFLLIASGSISLTLTECTKNGILGTLLSVVGLWLPYLLYYIGITAAGNWGLARIM